MTFCVPPMVINFYSTRFLNAVECGVDDDGGISGRGIGIPRYSIGIRVSQDNFVYIRLFICCRLFFLWRPKKGNHREQKNDGHLHCTSGARGFTSNHRRTTHFFHRRRSPMLSSTTLFWIELYFICLMIIYQLFIVLFSSRLRFFFRSLLSRLPS